MILRLLRVVRKFLQSPSSLVAPIAEQMERPHRCMLLRASGQLFSFQLIRPTAAAANSDDGERLSKFRN
jgi:hypothetical protein